MVGDLSAFVQVFLEESFEGLEQYESLLLNFDASDKESINSIFRVMHSIKGGAGTFGFNDIGGFAHILETLLDDVREDKLEVTSEIQSLLLDSGDCIKEMLVAADSGGDIDEARVADLTEQLKRYLGDSEVPAVPAAANTAAATDTSTGAADAGQGHWHIAFKPYPSLFASGNDPLRIIAALKDLGEVSVTLTTKKLPDFDDFHADDCYLAWDFTVAGDASEDDVREVFEWVEFDCDLEIQRVGDAPTSDAPEADASAESPAVPDAAVDASDTPEPTADTAAAEAATPAPATPAKAVSAGKAANKPAASGGAAAGGSIRVNIDKIDSLINMVGELVITQSMLGQLRTDMEDGATEQHVEKLRDGLAQLDQHTRELQEGVMGIRMLPISFVFNRFPRLVHDTSRKLGKQIELVMTGENTEMDKTVMEKIGDPLVHLVRNAMDHGIEMPDKRTAAGKPANGTMQLNAYHQGGNIIVEVVDDGAGIDPQKMRKKAVEKGIIGEHEELSDEEAQALVFAPGFSTAAEVSDLSGRGVGMDVVRRNIKELGGSVDITSTVGSGTKFTIRLPLTLAILDGQLVKVVNETYVIPLTSIVESLQVEQQYIKTIAADTELYRLREHYIPVLRMRDAFNIPGARKPLAGSLLVVVESGDKQVGLLVDDLLGQQQAVIKNLDTNYKAIEGVSGATILGDGTVALILDVNGLIDLETRQRRVKQVAV